MKTVCVIKDIPRDYKLDMSWLNRVEGCYELTPEQSLSRFTNNAKFDVEILPQEHNTGFMAIVRTASEASPEDVSSWINKP